MVRSSQYLYILNDRPELTNGGPLDAVNSPSFADLLEAREQGELTPLQQDIFLASRPVEEFYDCTADPNQATNLIADPQYAAIISELKNTLKQWQEETGDTRPAVIRSEEHTSELQS